MSALVLMPTINTTPYSEIVLQDSPFAYWRLDEPAAIVGTVLADSSGNDRDGTYSGTPGTVTVNQPPLIGGVDPGTSAEWDGASVAYGDVAKLSSGEYDTAAWTLELWANLTNVNVNHTIMSTGNSALAGGRGIFMGTTSAAEMVIVGWTGAAFTTFKTGAGVLSPGTTYHLVYQWSDNNYARFYKDGSLVAEVPHSNTLEGGQNFHVTIGMGHTGGYSDPCYGRLDEIAFYDFILDSDRIATHHLFGAQ